MKILVTGANGFIGRNLITTLKCRGYDDIFEYDLGVGEDVLETACREAEFVFHLAGVNRPERDEEFVSGNTNFTACLLGLLRAAGNASPVLFTSSIQAVRDNPYGRSKSDCEDIAFSHASQNASEVYVYRLLNVFGKWCRPNYNSVVATFCYNVSRDLPLRIDNPDAELRLVYIDNVVEEFIAALNGAAARDGKYCAVSTGHSIKLGELASKLTSFQDGRKCLFVPPLYTAFDRALYATWLSYLPHDDVSYALDLKTDERGCLAEFIKSDGSGQMFVSKTKPGITRGNHWHHTKCEKFIVISGSGTIRLRAIDGAEIIERPVSGDAPEVVDILPGYTHSITNTGGTEMITLFWASEIFDTARPDTYFLKVLEDV